MIKLKTDMNKISLYIAGAALMVVPTSCIQEFSAQQHGYITSDQAATAPGSYDNFVSGLIDNNNGHFFFGSADQRANDFGYS